MKISRLPLLAAALGLYPPVALLNRAEVLRRTLG